MGARTTIQPQLSADHRYKALILGDVTTVNEAGLLFNKGESTVWHHIHKGHLETRKQLTGGVLISMRSLIKLWGEPRINLETAYVGKGKHGHQAASENGTGREG